MAVTFEVKAAALADIKHHLATVGPENWAVVRAKYDGQISDRAWWRLVKDAKTGRPSREDLAKSVRIARRAVERNLPAAPSPSHVATAGQASRANLNFLGHISEV